jgi:hypothetical protein
MPESRRFISYVIVNKQFVKLLTEETQIGMKSDLLPFTPKIPIVFIELSRSGSDRAARLRAGD